MIKKEKKQEIPGIGEVMNIFYKVNPTLNWGNKTYRASAELMIKKFGLSNTKTLAELAISVMGKPYAPTITNPYELKEKLLKLKIYLEQNKEINKSNITKI